MRKTRRMKNEEQHKHMVRHHIVNRCNNGASVKENLLLIEESKEKLIHKIFGNRDFYAIIIFILRIARAKHYEKVNPEIKGLYKFLN